MTDKYTKAEDTKTKRDDQAEQQDAKPGMDPEAKRQPAVQLDGTTPGLPAREPGVPARDEDVVQSESRRQPITQSIMEHTGDGPERQPVMHQPRISRDNGNGTETDAVLREQDPKYPDPDEAGRRQQVTPDDVSAKDHENQRTVQRERGVVDTDEAKERERAAQEGGAADESAVEKATDRQAADRAEKGKGQRLSGVRKK